jgi:hypothetical protein
MPNAHVLLQGMLATAFQRSSKAFGGKTGTHRSYPHDTLLDLEDAWNLVLQPLSW